VFTELCVQTLLQLPYINNCVVLALGKEGEDKQLAAYIVLNDEKTKKDLRAALKRRLPFYMIPTYFILMDKYVRVCARASLPCA
jgi:acyl-CoA synthetase (AMP-forming)/AMP-acid ligase II